MTLFCLTDGNTWLNDSNAVSVQGDKPEGRYYFAYDVIYAGPLDSMMIIHGGRSPEYLVHSNITDELSSWSDELFQFRFSDHEWTKLTPTCDAINSCPSPRSGHLGLYTPDHGFVSTSEIVHQHKINHVRDYIKSTEEIISIAQMIFGGETAGSIGGVAIMDSWAYNPVTNVWTQLPDMPEARLYHAGCYDAASNSIYIHGGNV